jgi:hypothetical protein
MQGLISNRTLLEPKNLADAVRMLRDDGPLAPMAGCTDLYVSLNFGTLGATRFLNLWQLAGCARLTSAAASCRSAPSPPTPRSSVRLSSAGARRCCAPPPARSAVQIQNRGTIGGNVANASPAGDTLPVLAAAEAIVAVERGWERAYLRRSARDIAVRHAQDELVAALAAHARSPMVPEGGHARVPVDLEGRDGRSRARRRRAAARGVREHRAHRREGAAYGGSPRSRRDHG